MANRTSFSWMTARAVFVLSLSLTAQARVIDQQGRFGGFRPWLQRLANSAGAGGSLAGSWQGSKIENDPIHGGYLSLNFAFTFSSDRTYQETAYMGSRQVMSARGTYRQNGNRLSFTPKQCSFASPDLGQTVKFFPIPTDSPAEDIISFSPLEGGSQISLKDVASGDQWGLKPAPTKPSTDSRLSDADHQESTQNSAPKGSHHTGTPAANLIGSSDVQSLPVTPNASPEAIFKRMATPIELEIYNHATSDEQRVIRERAVLAYRRSQDGRSTLYDDVVPGISAEAIFKATTTDSEMLDTYNLATLDQQRAMRIQGMIEFIVHRLGIALSSEQVQRVAQLTQ